MNKKSDDNPRAKGRKARRIVAVAAASAAAAVLVVAGCLYVASARITANAVPIVTALPKPAASPTPIPTPNLPEITGEPADLGEDFDEPVSTTSGTVQPTATPTVTPTAQPIYRQEPIEGSVINILVIGQDLRPNEQGMGRSDTMMILSYHRKKGRASIVSMMRDTWVPIQGHGWNRLNTAFRFGGPGLAVNTVNDLFKLDIQNYIVVNFDGVVELIDRIGGIEVKISKVESAYYRNSLDWDVAPGLQRLNGQEALVHARNRKSNGGDFERVRRQQDIMMAVYKKLAAIRDPVLLADLTGFLLQNVKTNIPPDTLFSMGMEIVQKPDIDVARGRVPADKTWKYSNKDGRSVITIDFKKNTNILHDLIYLD